MIELEVNGAGQRIEPGSIGELREQIQRTVPTGHGLCQLIVDGRETKILTERDPANLPWNDMDIPIVIEATGLFRKRQDVLKHIESGGAQKVIITAPATEPDTLPVTY